MYVCYFDANIQLILLQPPSNRYEPYLFWTSTFERWHKNEIYMLPEEMVIGYA